MKSKNEKYGKGIDLYLPTNSKKKNAKEAKLIYKIKLFERYACKTQNT